ncbi:MAG: hypothetical protein ACKOBR_07075 [Actinomycetota bacterium]
MLTVYGVTLLAAKAKDEMHERAMRESVGSLIEPWLENTWPHVKRTNTTQVLMHSSVTDKVFRCEITEQHPTDDARQVTLVSIFPATRRGDLCVDIRREVRPTWPLILPRTRSERPAQSLTTLVADVARELRVRDANSFVSGSPSRVSTSDEGAAVAALIDAPSRRLPVVVECTSTRGTNTATTADTARVLTGIAHVYHLTTTAAEQGFNDHYGKRKASSSWVLVAWPRAGKTIMLTEYPQSDDERLVDELIAAAVGALPPLPRPSTRPQSTPSVPIQQVVANTSSPEVGDLRRKNQELEQRVAELQADYDDLHENLTLTDHLNGKIVEERERYLNQLTEPLALRDNTTQWNRTLDVVQRAKRAFVMLDFHPDVEDRLGSTQFSPATNQRIFAGLLELNNLAARLRRGDIEPHLFNTYCAEKFNFASSVSDNAVNKFGSDYTIMWQGAPVQLGPHVRCNEARIYFYVDAQGRRVVIGHVGSHLRDKSHN